MGEQARGSGIVAAGMAPLADAFAALTAGGSPVAMVIRRRGTVLVDLDAGTDRAGNPFTTSTPVLLYGAIKPAVALAALLAIADGALELDDRVVAHWQAFGTPRQGGGHGPSRPVPRRCGAWLVCPVHQRTIPRPARCS